MPVEEHDLIAFEPSPLPAGPWLVFAPHADDETFGMGGSLIRAEREGIDTHLVVLTDGALGGERPDLVVVRRAEVEKAATLLGIDTLSYWNQPDRGLRLSAELIAKAAASIREFSPASVFFPGPVELHPDHRMAGRLVWAALQGLGAEAPTALSYEIGVQNPANTLIDISAQIEAKAEVMMVYASQNDENDYPDLVLALNKGRTFTMPAAVQYAEAFYRYSPAQLQRTLAEATLAIYERYLD